MYVFVRVTYFSNSDICFELLELFYKMKGNIIKHLCSSRLILRLENFVRIQDLPLGGATYLF